VKLKELKDVERETRLMIAMFTIQLRRGEYNTREEELEKKLILADFVLLKDELEEHIKPLDRMLKVCEAVANGRYLEDCQRCHWGKPCAYACTSAERCEGFDDRDPYTAIADTLEELQPFTDDLRRWVMFQLSYQRK
jgi:hypothetical protein